MAVCCMKCRFWECTADKSDDPLLGACKRHPPQIIRDVDPSNDEGVWAASLFPLTDSEEWCGEFASNESEK